MRHKILLLTVLSCIVFASCEKFLTNVPTTSISGDNLLASESSAEAAVTDIYVHLNAIYFGNPIGTYLGNASKCRVWTGTRKTEQYEQCHNMTLFSLTSDNKNMYAEIYAGVNSCNNILYYLPDSPLSDEYKQEIEGETRFLRAYLYFTLVRLYGDVPLVVSPVLEIGDLNLPRTRYQEVYKFILDELDFAGGHMRNKERQLQINPNGSRAYDYAVYAVKSQVYTWIASYVSNPYDQFFDCTKEGRYPDFTASGIDTPDQAWQLALQNAEKVISDPLSPYALESDFRNLFRWDPTGHPEDYYSPERILATANTPFYGPKWFIVQTLWLHPAESISMTGSQSIAGRTRPARWIWEKWCTKYGNTALNSTGFHKASEDPRMSATYQYGSYTYWDQTNIGEVKTSSKIFPDSKSGTSSNHYFRKYLSKNYDYNCGDADCYILRMAEIYLNAAEAAANLGDMDKAVFYVNKILERARNSVDDISQPASQPANWSVTDFASAEELIDAIMLERIFEMHGENHEWFDTHRKGAAWLVENICIPFVESMNDSKNSSVKKTMDIYDKETETDVQNVRKSLLCAFPDYELRTNTALSSADQNDFYIR